MRIEYGLAVLALVANLGTAAAQERETTILAGTPTPEQIIKALSPSSGGTVLESTGFRKDIPLDVFCPESTVVKTEAVCFELIDEPLPPVSGRTQSDGPITIKDVALQIQFEFDSAKLTASAKTILDNVAIAMNSDKLAQNKFLMEGHTDSAGPNSYNFRLSELRAARAKSYLVETRGIAPSRITSEGRGELYPLAGSRGDDPANRRVNIVTGWQSN